MEFIKLSEKETTSAILGKYEFERFNKTNLKKLNNSKRKNGNTTKRRSNRSKSRLRNSNSRNRKK